MLPCVGTPPIRPGCSRSYPACLWTLPGMGHSLPPWEICSSISPIKKFLPNIDPNFPLFQFVPINPCSDTIVPDRVPLWLPSRPLLMLECCSEISSTPFLLQADQLQLSGPVFRGEMLQSSYQLYGPSTQIWAFLSSGYFYLLFF